MMLLAKWLVSLTAAALLSSNTAEWTLDNLTLTADAVLLVKGADQNKVKVTRVLHGQWGERELTLPKGGPPIGESEQRLLFVSHNDGEMLVLAVRDYTKENRSALKVIRRRAKRYGSTFRLRLKPVKERYVRGKKIGVSLTIGNLRESYYGVPFNKRFLVGSRYDRHRELYFEVTSPSGKVMNGTFAGKTSPPRRSDLFEFPSQANLVYCVNLDDYFDFRESGVYRVRATYINAESGARWRRGIWFGVLSSKAVSITVDATSENAQGRQ